MPDDLPSVQAAPGSDPPGAVFAPSWIWELDASPGALEAIAEVLRSVGSAGDVAQDTMDRAAFRIAADGAWEGATADAYYGHRAKLSRDLAEFAERSRPPARALDETAAVLRRAQDVLTEERDRLSPIPGVTIPGVPPWFSGAVIFYPRDEGEAETVRKALAMAEQMRARVDRELRARIAVFRDAGTRFQAIVDAWQPRTVTHLNLNAGMGKGAGTVRENLDELADAIASGDADVVTLQEVLHDNLEDYEDDEGNNVPGLLSLLEERTGQQWTVAADSAPIDPNPEEWDPDNPGDQPYGNVVLVREGGPVEVSAGSDLDPGGEDDAGLSLSDPDDAAGLDSTPEDRAAAVAEVTVRE